MIRLISIFIFLILLVSCKSETKEIFSTINSPRTNQPISLSKEISSKILEDHSFKLDDLRILRNEIFARKGYIFKSEDLTDYFSEFDWYTPKHSSDEIDIHLSELDKLNIEVISNYEKFLKENIWLTKSYSTFTFEDLLACIPEFSLPLDFDYVQYKDPEALDRFYSLDQKLKFKYNLKDGEPYGKIPINDTITAVGLIAASDLHVYRTVVIVDNQGNRLDYFHIPFSFSSSNDYDETLDETLEREVFTEYTNTVITSDFKQIAKGWDITTIRDSLGNTINEIYSDTAVGISEIKEITQFLD